MKIHLNVDFPPLTKGVIEISRSRLEIHKFYAHPTTVCFGVFYKFLGDFGVYLGGDSFFKGLVKLGEIITAEDLM